MRKPMTSRRMILEIVVVIATIGPIGTMLCSNVQAQTAQSAMKPQITNAKVDVREVKASLAQEVDAWAAAAEKAQWLGYSVPAVVGEHNMC